MTLRLESGALPGRPARHEGEAPAALHLPGRVLDVDAGTLRDAAGQVVPMRPQAWAVLELLARQAGQVVTKEQLLATVWPGLVVSDGSIAQAVSEVRAALGPPGRRIIETVSRRGYLFVAPPAPPSTTGDGQDDGRAGPTDPSRQAAQLTPPPRPIGPLFGRDAELDALCALMTQHRLVSVLGAGGIGKTVLAAAAARRHVEVAGGLAAWADLTGIGDAALLPATVARALALPIGQREEPLQGLLAALRSSTAWLVLDNAEHVIDAVAAFAAAALDAAPGLRLLITSQAALHLEGERLLRLSTLGVPATDEPFDSAAQAPSVAMFVDRASAADHGFELTPRNLPSVVRMCRRLDGLPLAIRLAAGRAHLLGLSGLEAHLDDRFRWLAAPSRATPTRQQTLAAALDWSYGLLAASEQRLFGRLGVFVGGFTLELAIAVGRGDGVDDQSVISELEGLVERSLIGVVGDERPRYRLLESPREHALRQLTLTGELEGARRDHAEALAQALGDAAEAFWSTPDRPWLERWGPELDNLRAAIAWSAPRDVAVCARLIAGAGAVFRLLDLPFELARRAGMLDEASLEHLDPALAARFWLVRSYLESGHSGRRMFDFARLAEHAARAASTRRELYLALCQQGANAPMTADSGDGLLAEISKLESADWPPRVRCQRAVAEFALHNFKGRWPLAQVAAQRGLALAMEAGSIVLTSVFATWTVVARLGAGDVEAARMRSQAVRQLVLPGPPSMVIRFIGTCARIALKQGDLAAARVEFGRLFELARSVEWVDFEVFGYLYVGLALAEGRHASAARLFGYATVASRRAWGVDKPSRARDAATAELSRVLGPEAFERGRAEGLGLDIETVCRLTLEDVRGSQGCAQ